MTASARDTHPALPGRFDLRESPVKELPIHRTSLHSAGYRELRVVDHAETFEKLSAAGGHAWSFGALASRSIWRARRGRVGESPNKPEDKIDTANHGIGSEEMLQSRSPNNR